MKPTTEALKEVSRLFIFLAISWFIAETMVQLDTVPASYQVKVYVFTYTIPLRMAITSVLTMVGRYIDKWIHENKDIRFNGLLPW